MLKLKRYMKPYLGFLLAAVLLLFGQAMLELELPNMMSNIVNIGIQQGGITQAAPDAIDADAMALMKQFMSTEDQAVVDEAYSPFDSLADTDKLYKTYPEADGTTLALTGDGSAASGAFSRASYALLQVLEQVGSQSGQSFGDADSKTMDLSRMNELLPLLQQLPRQVVDDAIAASAATPDMMLEQTAAVFTKSF